MAEEKKTSEAIPPAWVDALNVASHVSRFAELVQEGRLPQVLLLTGRAGIFKRHLLSALTGLLVCDDGRACGLCDGCQKLLSGVHPEVLWLDAGGGRYLNDDAALVQDHLSISPGFGAIYRVVVVIDIDLMGRQCANRLLKTIEEPPSSSKLFFTTSRVGAILPTILSRTIRWHVPPPQVEESLAWLAKEKPEVSREELSHRLKRAGFSPIKALQDLSGQVSRERGLLGSLQDLIDSEEIAWNDHYRQVLLEGKSGCASIGGRLESRSMLKQARRLVQRGQVPLNSQLLLDTLDLLRHSERSFDP